MKQGERLVSTRQFNYEVRRQKITSLNDRLNRLNNQFGRGNGADRKSLVDARRAFQSGSGEWTDRNGRKHELAQTNIGYTEDVFVASKPNHGRYRR